MTPQDLELSRRFFSPNGFWLWNYIIDPSVRYIVLFGGSSSGKSFAVAQLFTLRAFFEGTNHIVMRKVGASIEKTIYADFRAAIKQLRLTDACEFKQNCIEFTSNGAKIDFSGLDNPEKIKGISQYKRVFLDELSEYTEEDFKQIRLRLRGMEGQQIVSAFNPISEEHWIKKHWFDREEWNDVPQELTIEGETLKPALCRVKSVKINSAKQILNPVTGEFEEHAPDTIVIQSTYLNNFWVVGSPDGRYGYYDYQAIANFEHDRIHDPDYYRIYALGEWGVIRTGSEFFGSFNTGRHTAPTAYDTDYPIHVSVDNNVLPYISVSFWQYITEDGKRVVQIGELCAETPDNTVKRAAKATAQRLRSLGYTDKLYLHGDASTRAANTIDDDKRSWLDLFIFTLEAEGVEVVDCVGYKNPSVAMTGEFINAIFEGTVPDISITIGKECPVSIEDYLSVQKDANGAILKTKVKNKTTNQVYEEHGHLSDCFRYIAHDLLREEFTIFSNRRKRNLFARDGAIRFYNPATEDTAAVTRRVLYVLPNIGGRFCLLEGVQVGEYWRVVDVVYHENTSTDEIAGAVESRDGDMCIVECGEAYYQFVRRLRATAGMPVRICDEEHDPARRIAATSDFVRSNVLFNETAVNESGDYSEFVTHLLDYNADKGRDIEASVLLSGFVSYVIKK